jgi:putative flippase GtrA
MYLKQIQARFPTPLKFIAIGCLGVITNLSVFTVVNLVSTVLIASTFAFLISVTQNFVLHGIVTWSREFRDIKRFKTYIPFVTGYLFGGCITILSSHSLHEYFFFSPPFAQITGIGLATVLNYFVSYFVLGKH